MKNAGSILAFVGSLFALSAIIGVAIAWVLRSYSKEVMSDQALRIDQLEKDRKEDREKIAELRGALTIFQNQFNADAIRIISDGVKKEVLTAIQTARSA